MVLAFHTYARWPDLLPWTTGHKDFPIFKYGFLGVELFFLISGFVISMTLERCRGFGEFIYRRWLRLFPAMLLATVFVFVTVGFFHERPLGIPEFKDTLPGLMFIDPGVFSRLFGVEFHPLEGVFWSLYVEVKFYVIFGILYFINRERALYLLTALFLAMFVYKVGAFSHAWHSAALERVLYTWLSLQFFGWFCTGAFCYAAYEHQRVRYLAIAVVVLLPAIQSTSDKDFHAALGGMLVFLIFYAALFTKLSALASSKALVFVGFISYPMYLIHENIMVASTIKVHARFGWVPDIMTPWPGVAAIVLVAYLIAQYAEPATRRALAPVTRFALSARA